MSTSLTRVLTIDRPRRAISVLAFGMPFSEDRGADETGIETVRLFSPGALFCIVWWRRFGRRRQHRTLAVLEAAPGHVQAEPVGNVQPNAIVHVFIDQYGPAGVDGSVDQLLDLIQNFKVRGIEPERVSARYWRCTAHRILRGLAAPELAESDYPKFEPNI